MLDRWCQEARAFSSRCCSGRAPTGPRRRPVSSTKQALTVQLNAIGDTYLTSGSPNQNQGGETFFRLQSSGKNRGLLFFDAAAVRQAASAGALVSARLELVIHSAGTNWGTTGRPIAAHRLKQASAEYSATWNCAIDATVHNQSADCSGATAWAMASTDPAVQPWLSPASATAVITNGQTGTVSFDVTADIADIVAGAWPGHGWLVKKVDEGQNGAVDFKSKEQGGGARLVLDVQAAPPPDAGSPVDAGSQSATVVASADTHVRQGQPNQNFGSDAILRLPTTATTASPTRPTSASSLLAIRRASTAAVTRTPSPAAPAAA